MAPTPKRAPSRSAGANRKDTPARETKPRRRSAKAAKLDETDKLKETAAPPPVVTTAPPRVAPPARLPLATATFAAGIFDASEIEAGGPDVALEDSSDEIIAVNETVVVVEPPPPRQSYNQDRPHERPSPPPVTHRNERGSDRGAPRGPAPAFRAEPDFAVGFDDDVPPAHGSATRAIGESNQPHEGAASRGTTPGGAAPAGSRGSGAGAESGTDESGEPRRRGRRRGGRGRRRGRDRDSNETSERPFPVGGIPLREPPIDDDEEDTAVAPSDVADVDEIEDAAAEIGDEDSMRAMTGPIALPGVTRETKMDDGESPRRRAPRFRRMESEDEVSIPAADPDEVPANREMLINVSDPDECRIAIMREGRLDELYIERAAHVSNVMNIYKGRVTNVESSIQAAFVDFGKPAHGFLHISDLHPRYFPESKGEPELVGRKTPRRARPPIQNCLRRGQEVIVQVIKEGIGTKGPTLSTYLSLPGRFLVMMPGMDQHGVSRKVEDPEARRKTREVLNELTLPPDMGFIVRTAGVGRTKRDLQRDLNYLVRLWNQVARRTREEPAPTELYKESDLVIRTIRDVYDASLRRIIVDDAPVAERVREFLSIASPQAEDAVTVYEDTEPLFHRLGIEAEIDKLHSRTVPLNCGGSLVIESTEALVAIDVNSGRFRVPESAEETAYRVNLEAADEIARQLRLRDLGGLIICDFIDMMQEKHRRTVERRLAEALRSHKERAKLLRISRFGILEMTRQRQRASFAKNMFAECPRCSGSGRVKSTESVCLDVMRQIRLASQRESVASIDVSVSLPVATELLNRKRHALTDMERTSGQSIRIHAEAGFSVDDVRIACTDRRGRDLVVTAGPSQPIARIPSRPATAAPAASADSPRGSRPPGTRSRRGSRGGRGRGGRSRGGSSAANGGTAEGSVNADRGGGIVGAGGPRDRPAVRKGGPPRGR